MVSDPWAKTAAPAHTVAAVVDRGNYPVVSFDGVDTWPSIIAANQAEWARFVAGEDKLQGLLIGKIKAGMRRGIRST